MTQGGSGPRPGAGATGQTTAGEHVTDSIAADEWADTYAAAYDWVMWTARRRWPHHPANDEIWAMSVTSWYHGGRRVT